jgi:hypothetical protein
MLFEEDKDLGCDKVEELKLGVCYELRTSVDISPEGAW